MRCVTIDCTPMTDPDQVWIGPEVRIAQDVELIAPVHLMGATSIGEDCLIGPNARVTDAAIGDRCTVQEAVVLKVALDEDTVCGPFAVVRLES